MAKSETSFLEAEILLIGHEYHDVVFHPNSGQLFHDVSNIGTFAKRKGGIWNLARVFSDLQTSHFVTVQPETGAVTKECLPTEGVIRIDTVVVEEKRNSERTSLVEGGGNSSPVNLNPLLKCGVAHIAYIDQTNLSLDSWALLQSSAKLISGDLSIADPDEIALTKISAALPYLDVVFCNELEWEFHRNQLLTLLNSSATREKVPQTLIVHGQNSILVQNQSTTEVVPIQRDEGLPALGAGDVFAAYVLQDLAIGAEEPIDAVRNAHEKTLAWLKKGGHS